MHAVTAMLIQTVYIERHARSQANETIVNLRRLKLIPDYYLLSCNNSEVLQQL